MPSDSDLKTSVELLMQLLEIPGPSCQERAIAERVQALIIDAGASTAQFHTDQSHLQSPQVGEIGNLVLRLPGTRPGPRRLLVAHLDTVPICVGCQPKQDGGQLFSADPATGLGADNRAGVAVLVWLAQKLLRESHDHPPLTFLWTVQEEIGLQGARLLDLDLLQQPDIGFNWDGGSPQKITIGATGGYRMKIDVLGKASHAGNAPQCGVSAIAAASIAISELHQTGWHGKIQTDDQQGTSNIGVIQGGQATNVVTERVVVRCEARSHDPQFRQQIVHQIRAAFERAARAVTNEQGESARVEFEGKLDYESFCLPTDHPAIDAASRAIREVGLVPELAIANGGLDANWLSARGIPTVSLGCGQSGQHTVEERLDVEQFQAACQIALHVATDR